jgi:5,10-methylene-tetrahydrofolate dehydrogenase/methenyl tetrahydrofolate cyclohydrolase
LRQSSSVAAPSWVSASECCGSPETAPVTYCHSRTIDLPGIVADADIVIAAVGHPELIKGDWIKPGAVVIDAGSHRTRSCGKTSIARFATSS